jgi:hypothetical protein
MNLTPENKITIAKHDTQKENSSTILGKCKEGREGGRKKGKET